MTSTLADLLVSEDEKIQELLATVLVPFVQLGAERGAVMFTSQGRRLPVRLRIVLVLLGRKALRVLGRLAAETEGLTPTGLAKALRAPGGTVRPAVRQLAGEGLVVQEGRTYVVPDEVLTNIHEQFPPVSGEEETNG